MLESLCCCTFCLIIPVFFHQIDADVKLVSMIKSVDEEETSICYAHVSKYDPWSKLIYVYNQIKGFHFLGTSFRFPGVNVKTQEHDILKIDDKYLIST